MMENKIEDLVSRYLRDEIQISDFQVWFYAFYFEVRNRRDRDGMASELCDKIALPLAEFSRGHRSEASLRQEVAEAIRPFVEPVRSYARPKLIYGKPLMRASSAYPAQQILKSATM